MWDLSDLRSVEILRSPGSVTYGPGAVAGVINVKTKEPMGSQGRARLHFAEKERSLGLSLAQSFQWKGVEALSHLSMTRTKGYPAQYFLGDDGAGFVGEGQRAGEATLDYFADFQDIPQIKILSDVHLEKDWRVWLRYTQQGSTWKGNEIKSDFGNGDLVNQQSIQVRQGVVAVEKEFFMEKGRHLKGSLSFDTLDTERRRDSVRHPDPDHPQNKVSDFAEHELFTKWVYTFSPRPWAAMAFGGELSYEHFGAGWQDGHEQMRLGGYGQIVSNAQSDAISTRLTAQEATFVGMAGKPSPRRCLEKPTFASTMPLACCSRPVWTTAPTPKTSSLLAWL